MRIGASGLVLHPRLKNHCKTAMSVENKQVSAGAGARMILVAAAKNCEKTSADPLRRVPAFDDEILWELNCTARKPSAQSQCRNQARQPETSGRLIASASAAARRQVADNSRCGSATQQKQILPGVASWLVLQLPGPPNPPLASVIRTVA